MPPAPTRGRRSSTEVARRPRAPLVAQAALLGLPVAAVGERVAGEAGGRRRRSRRRAGPVGRSRPGPAPSPARRRSSWICRRCGPGRCAPGCWPPRGREVVKVESVTRPDGARRGPGAVLRPAPQRAAGGGARPVVRRRDADALRDLLGAADVVIEASRPRALAQLGLAPDDLGPDGPGLWLSITGHGRSGTGADRVAFGDDAAAAGGLVAWIVVGSRVRRRRPGRPADRVGGRGRGSQSPVGGRPPLAGRPGAGRRRLLGRRRGPSSRRPSLDGGPRPAGPTPGSATSGPRSGPRRRHRGRPGVPPPPLTAWLPAEILWMTVSGGP